MAFTIRELREQLTPEFPADLTIYYERAVLNALDNPALGGSLPYLLLRGTSEAPPDVKEGLFPGPWAEVRTPDGELLAAGQTPVELGYRIRKRLLTMVNVKGVDGGDRVLAMSAAAGIQGALGEAARGLSLTFRDGWNSWLVTVTSPGAATRTIVLERPVASDDVVKDFLNAWEMGPPY